MTFRHGMNMKSRIGLLVCRELNCPPGDCDLDEISRFGTTLSVSRKRRQRSDEPALAVITADVGNCGFTPASVQSAVRSNRLTHIVALAATGGADDDALKIAATECGLAPGALQILDVCAGESFLSQCKEEVTEYAKYQLALAVRRIVEQTEGTSDCGNILVIGSDSNAVSIAREYARPQNTVYLVPGDCGNSGASRPAQHPLDRDGESLVSGDSVTILTDREVADIRGFSGNYEVQLRPRCDEHDVRSTSGKSTLRVGTILLSSHREIYSCELVDRLGLDSAKVINTLQLQQMLRDFRCKCEADRANMDPDFQTIAIIQCMSGCERRSGGECNGVSCATNSIQLSHDVAQELGAHRVLILESSWCLSGKGVAEAFNNHDCGRTEYVRVANSADVHVDREPGGATVRFDDRSEHVDIVAVSTQMLNSQSCGCLAHLVGTPVASTSLTAPDGKVRQVSTTANGIHILSSPH